MTAARKLAPDIQVVGVNILALACHGKHNDGTIYHHGTLDQYS